jgi:hypothetical protein
VKSAGNTAAAWPVKWRSAIWPGGIENGGHQSITIAAGGVAGSRKLAKAAAIINIVWRNGSINVAMLM